MYQKILEFQSRLSQFVCNSCANAVETMEIMDTIAQGLSNREVGNRLYLTLNTVKAHSRSIYSKLGGNNRTQAVAKSRALGLLSD